MNTALNHLEKEKRKKIDTVSLRAFIRKIKIKLSNKRISIYCFERVNVRVGEIILISIFRIFTFEFY